MDIKPIVEKAYRDVILNASCNSELKRALNESARVRGVVQNIYKELVTADAYRRQKMGKATSHSALKSTAEDLFKLFIHGLIREIEVRERSDLARIAEETKAQQAKDLEAAENGQASGDYVELVERGLKIGDTIVDEA